jgi:hypothetical protein
MNTILIRFNLQTSKHLRDDFMDEIVFITI